MSNQKTLLISLIFSALLSLAPFVFITADKNYDFRYFQTSPKTLIDDFIKDLGVVDIKIKGSVGREDDSGLINNLHEKIFFVWSQGDFFLDKNKFLNEEIFKITFDEENIRVLGISLKSSRDDLKIKSVFNKDGSISFKFINEQEGFENNDGIMISIIYTGESNGFFDIKTRIKGGLDAVSEFDINKGNRQSSKYSTFIILTLFFFILTFFSFMVLRALYDDLRGVKSISSIFCLSSENLFSFKNFKTFIWRIFELTFTILFVTGLFYVYYRLFLYLLNVKNTFIPDWIFKFIFGN